MGKGRGWKGRGGGKEGEGKGSEWEGGLCSSNISLKKNPDTIPYGTNISEIPVPLTPLYCTQ